MTTTTDGHTYINVNENPTATNTVAADESINFPPSPPPPPSNTAAVHEPINFPPALTNIVGADELTSFPPPPPPNTGAIDEPINFPPPPTPTNTVSIDKPISFHPPTTNTAAVDKPTDLQQTPTNTVTVDKPLNFQPPLINTVAVDKSLNFQPAPPDEVVDKVTIPKPVEDTVFVDDATNLKASITQGLPPIGLTKKGTIAAILCGSSTALIILAIASIIPLLQLIIGWRYADQCPVSWRIPHYLVVAGVVGLAIIILGIIQNALKLYKDSKPHDRNSLLLGGYKIASIVLLLLSIFTFVWFIAGCIWIFGVWNEVQYKRKNRSDYCHPILYRFAFWLLLFSILYHLFTCCRVCNQARQQFNNVKRGAATRVPTTEP